MTKWKTLPVLIRFQPHAGKAPATKGPMPGGGNNKGRELEVRPSLFLSMILRMLFVLAGSATMAFLRLFTLL